MEIEENKEEINSVVNRRLSRNINKCIIFRIGDYVYLTYEEALNGQVKSNWMKAMYHRGNASKNPNKTNRSIIEIYVYKSIYQRSECYTIYEKWGC